MVSQKYAWTFVICFLTLTSINAQNTEKKVYHIQRTLTDPKIDAILDDPVWQKAKEAKDFVMFKPGNGNVEPEGKKTIVKMAYDDKGLYLAAYLYDDKPENIDRQFSTRDNISQADFFIVSINPYNDGINDVELLVSSAGTQADAKVSNAMGKDWNWSAVWDSAVKITEEGWFVEMFIPYAVLRFSNTSLHNWGVNFHRRITATKEQYSWNYIDKTKGNIMQYAGLLKGIKDINAPVRLSFYPYAQGTINKHQNDYSFNATVGMDIKYGINDSFTLDATLIPDFGQTGYDEVVLNLGPFEQQYDEKRAFFTEGTELLSKGNLLYFRRIGNSPKYYDNTEKNLKTNESVIENPDKTKLLNAIKLTGRTKSGFGVGVFNAFSAKTQATVRDTLTNKERQIITDPFTNFSAFVLDQQFKNTSSITLVNSNVMRQGPYMDANVTSLLADIRLFDEKYVLDTDFSLSNQFYQTNTKTGFQGDIGLYKISGAHRFSVSADLSDKTYDKNDFGIQSYNNFLSFFANYSYRIFEPTKHFNTWYFNVNMSHSRLFKPNTFTGTRLNINTRMTNKKELSYGGGLNFRLGKNRSYHEPQVEGRYIEHNPAMGVFSWVSSDYRKRFACDLDVEMYGETVGDKPYWSHGFKVSPRYRFSDKFNMVYKFDYRKSKHDKGYIKVLDNHDIIFGIRETKRYINSLNAVYNFSAKSALNLSLRHNWTPVKYEKQFYVLNKDGSLSKNDYTGHHNTNFNIWNFDLSYTWEFAPGSQLIALYRNTINHYDDYPDKSFSRNLNDLFNQSLNEQLSLRLVYYLDYNNIKNRFQ